MIKYTHYKIEYNEKYNSVIMNLNDENLLENGFLITNSIGSDIFDDFECIKEEIKKYFDVLNGKVLKYNGGGNVNCIQVCKEYTALESLFADDDEICKIETIELIKLILIWAEENFKYKNKMGILNANQMWIALNWVKEQMKRIDKY